MQSVISFDIFDTLIGRRCGKPVNVFTILERKTKLKAFAEERPKASVSCINTFEEIYDRLQKVYNWSDQDKEKYMQIELDEEYEQSYPIISNINLLKEEQKHNKVILISDMYMSAKQIAKLLTKHDICVDKIYVSSETKKSKRNGDMYPLLLEKYQIKEHTGDNYESDFINSQKFGIKANHFYHEDFINIGSECFESKLDAKTTHTLLMLLHDITTGCTYLDKKKHLWNFFATVFIPLLIGFSIDIIRYCEKHHLTRILLQSRDCYYLQFILKIICKILNKNLQIQYFYTSKTCYNNCSAAFVKYFQKNYISEQTVIVDNYGSGGTIKNFFSRLNCDNYPHKCNMMWDSDKKIPKHDYMLVSNKYWYVLETICSTAPHGRVIDISEKGEPIFCPMEHDPEISIIFLEVCKRTVNYLEKYTNLLIQLYTDLRTADVWAYTFAIYFEDYMKALSNQPVYEQIKFLPGPWGGYSLELEHQRAAK